MLKLDKTEDELKSCLDVFGWDFKISDNILYNLSIVYMLVDDYNISGKDYKKPISVILVSIIEAIMVDFLYRLYRGTNHFPETLRHKENDIKQRLNDETVRAKAFSMDGEEYYYSVLKNFNFTPMIDVYEQFQLLGDNENVYKTLRGLAYFRNRLHINNYYNNFEKDENITFSESRVQKSIKVMEWIFSYFADNYARPWPKATDQKVLG